MVAGQIRQNDVSGSLIIRRLSDQSIQSQKDKPELKPENLSGIILAEEGSFSEKSQKMLGKAREAAPQRFEALDKLKEKHSEKITQLKEHGWHGMKGQANMTEVGEDGTSYDQFRLDVVNGVQKLSLGIMEECGFKNPGKYSATGTPGWNSDIDTVYFAPEGMSEEMQIVQKTLFDMIFLETFGGLPGNLFDTESYLSHAGMGLQTEKSLETPEGHAAFTRLEMTGAALQMVRQCGGPESEAWQAFKASHFEHAGDDVELKNALGEIFSDVEEFESHLNEQVERQVLRENGFLKESESLSRSEISEKCAEIVTEKPLALKLATMSYKAEGLVRVSQEIDELQSSQGGLTPQARDVQKLKIASLSMLRTTFFDEGYYAQGTFSKTCSNVTGQMHQRKIEDFRETLATASRSNADINLLIAQGRGFDFHIDQTPKTSSSQHASSVFENHAFYRGHFEHKVGDSHDDLDKHLKAVVATSKYSERVVDAAHALISSVPEGSPIVERAKTQLEKTQKILDKTRELEKVKRAKQLNSSTSKALIGAQLSPIDRERFEKDFSNFEKRIEDLRFEESLTPEDHYLLLLDNLAHAGYSQFEIAEENDYRGLPITSNPYFSDVLKARCGCQPDKKVNERAAVEEGERLSAILSQSHSLTVSELELNSVKKVKKFNRDIEGIATLAVHLSLSAGQMPKPEAKGNFREAVTLADKWKKHERLSQSI